jgi:hypothetical protein
MDSYVSYFLKISDFINSPTLLGEHCFLESILPLFYFSYYLLISGRDEIISVSKLLEWFMWKYSFT